MNMVLSIFLYTVHTVRVPPAVFSFKKRHLGRYFLNKVIFLFKFEKSWDNNSLEFAVRADLERDLRSEFNRAVVPGADGRFRDGRVRPHRQVLVALHTALHTYQIP